ncbi:MAG TPA: hypothetical protein VKA44_07250 [Gemmatimonadota bacterium]|nr:hypothetical protein [Gemmatimonadota bacterium]
MRVRRPPDPERRDPAGPLDLSGAGPPRLAGLLGAASGSLLGRLGPPSADTRTGEERWLRFEGAGWSLRVRLSGSASGERVSSWTLGLEPGVRTLRAAAEPVGLWPACAPDAAAPEVREPLLRRPLPDPGGGADRSLTASVRGGRVVALTAFDEAPDWR